MDQEITYFRVVRYRHDRGDMDDYRHLPRPRYSFAYIERARLSAKAAAERCMPMRETYCLCPME